VLVAVVAADVAPDVVAAGFAQAAGVRPRVTTTTTAARAA
jgi:hypothetical protein